MLPEVQGYRVGLIETILLLLLLLLAFGAITVMAALAVFAYMR